MSWKRSVLETFVKLAARYGPNYPAMPPAPRSIFVLRNNDIGDLLVVTPLFEALRRRFPHTRLVAGVGSWNLPVLESNPHLSGVMPVNAPWHNKFVKGQHALAAFQYIYASQESLRLRRQRFEVGIDVLGSPFGSLLLARAGIATRLGVKGYAGGDSGAHQCVEYDPGEHVGRAALGFAELLGGTEPASLRPQIFLRPAEEEKAEELWRSLPDAEIDGRLRIVVGPGGGFKEKCWPESHWRRLARMMAASKDWQVAVVGSQSDAALAESVAGQNRSLMDLTGRLRLRETFALVSRADLVVCNSSMLMHAAAAFSKPALVLLGDWFSSASAHAAQWGHGNLSLVLGRDAQHPQIYSPDEAFALLRAEAAVHSAAA